jgi:hypothetical protein
MSIRHPPGLTWRDLQPWCQTVFRLILYCLIAHSILPAGAATKVGSWSEQAGREWWTQHATPESWTGERESIHEQLLAVHQNLGTSKAIANSHFAGWMNHLKWLSLFPVDWKGHAFFKDESARAAYVQLAQQTILRDSFLNSLSPYDDHAKALEILCRIYRAHPADAGEFSALAVAFSLVFDQPFPGTWPHHFVNAESVPRTDEKPEDRFAFFVQSQKNGALLYDLKRLSVAELKFVIDTPVSLRELRYVQGVKLRDVKQFHTLFTMITYDMARLEKKIYLWPHGSYQLETIAKRGGLCVDQAYYTSHAAKTKGVPNIIFLGQGNSGEHAWLGYLESYGSWKFNLAKFRNENYPVGQAFDPQTWRRLTDSECEFLNRRPLTTSNIAMARRFLTWAELNPAASFHPAAFQLARKTAPEYLWAWELEAACLDRGQAGIAERGRFWNDWIKVFKDQQDLRFRGEKRLLGLLDEAGETTEYNRLLARIVADNKNQRFDLVVSVAAEKVFVHIENKRWEEAHKTFRAAMEKLASKAGGHLFYQLVQPYVQSCLEEGKTAYAEEAMERANKSFEARKGSILDIELRELADIVSAKAKRQVAP